MGDVRFGNTVLDDDGGPGAVLDWDMTSVGAPEHDLSAPGLHAAT